MFSDISFGQKFEDYSKLGYDAQVKEDYREAISQYLKAQQIEPNNISINRRIALMYYYLPMYDSSLFYYNLVLSTNPKDTVSYYQRGFVYQDKKDYQNSIKDFEKVNDLTANSNADAEYNIGKGFIGMYKYEDAIKYFKRALALQPNDKLSLWQLGNCYSSQKKPDQDEALKYFNQVLSIDKEYTPAYVSRGILYGERFKDFKRAHQDFDKALSMNPKIFAAYYYKGIYYYNEKDFGNSKDMFDKVIEISPDYAEGFYRRALAWYKIGVLNMVCRDLEKAEKLGFEKAISLKKDVCK